MKRTLCYTFLLILAGSVGSVWAIDDSEDVDHLAVTALLIKDGYYSRASASLANINLKEQDVEEERYYFLRGLLSLKNKKSSDALKDFKKAIRMGFDSKEIHLYVAEALAQQQKFDEALVELEKVSNKNKNQISFFFLKAEVFHKMGKRSASWNMLSRALKVKGKSSVVRKKMFSFLIKEKMYLAARDLVSEEIQQAKQPSAVLKMAALLRQEGQINFAVELLESINVKWPRRQDVALELSQAYLKKKMNFVATLLLEESSRTNRSLSNEVAGMLQHIGKGYRAQFVNFKVHDFSKRLRHQIAIYLDEDRFSKITELYPSMVKTGLMQDESLRYALSYSYFMKGQYSKAEYHLGQIKEDKFYEKAIELRKEIEKCRDNKDFCYETI